MRHSLRAVVIALACLGSKPDIACAQAPAFGYAFVSPIAVSHLDDRTLAWNAGGGAERWVGNGISVGGEVGPVGFPSTTRSGPDYTSSMPSAYALLVSVNASRHFRSDADWRPFITGGYSLLLSGEPLDSFNVGVGADRWITAHAGLRLEVREQLSGALLGFRVGVVFR